MPNTIQQQFEIIKQENRLGLMTHVVMGYPSFEDTKQRVKIMAEAGIDIIELQIPFSDPLADGPAITAANQTAIQQGATVQDCMNLAQELTRSVDIPLQFIGYFNTVINYGAEQFVNDSKASGIAGFTFPDLPYDEAEYEPFVRYAKAATIPLIQLASPNSTSVRLKRIGELAEGYVYCVARYGVTGSSSALNEELAAYLKRVRKYVTLPLAVGFGISTPEHIRQLHGIADMAVIGSALLNVPTNQLAETLQPLCASL